MIIKEKETKDFLTRTKIGSFAINPYIGCPHACKYCYATFMKRFTNHPEPWGDFLDVKICNKKISLKRISGKNVVISTATDPYNPYEKKYKVTRFILEQLVDSDCYLQILTKNKLVLRDLELLKKIENVSVALSINTLDECFRRDMDKASSIKQRIETLKTLHENNIYTILFMSPIFIGITPWKQIIEKTKDYVDEYWFENLNLRGTYKKEILEYIEKKYPELLPLYNQIYKFSDKKALFDLDEEILEYCKWNNINYKDYFQHEKVIKTVNDTILVNPKKK